MKDKIRIQTFLDFDSLQYSSSLKINSLEDQI